MSNRIVPSPRITAVRPVSAVEGGIITIDGEAFDLHEGLPQVRIGGIPTRVVVASSQTLRVLVPPELPGGRASVRVDTVPGETAFVEIGAPFVTGVHQVDNPIFDRAGNLYVTHSGARGQQVPVSLFRVRRDGVREPFVSGLVNATSLAFDAEGRLYVSSRFEGTVYRINPDGSYETFATELGVACGLAFDGRGSLYVGDRAGTIFRVNLEGEVFPFASLPPSVAAFHLAFGPDHSLYVTGPTLSSYDHVYRIDPAGRVDTVYSAFGRPQGLAFDSQGDLYVVEALAGRSGVYRLRGGVAEQVLTAPALVGIAFDPLGGSAVASNETVYRLDVPLRAV